MRVHDLMQIVFLVGIKIVGQMRMLKQAISVTMSMGGVSQELLQSEIHVSHE